jgi:UPF0755 protein
MFFNQTRLNYILGTILIIGLLFCCGLSNYKIILPEEGISIDIAEGDSVNTIAANLSKDGIIRFTEIFKLWLALNGRFQDLKAGSYTFAGSVSIKDVAESIANGDINPAFKITIPEGWSILDVRMLLVSKKLITKGETFDLSLLTDEEKAAYSFLKDWGTDNPEGLLYPDTYFLGSQMSAKEILQAILNDFNLKVYQPLQLANKTSGFSFKDTMILASLVEKEVVSSKDRMIVAGILEKRLQMGMPLQVDATICYIKRENGVSVCNLKNSDFQIDSFYNTYKYPGLPPGPICNPSLEAIEAVLNPQKTSYLYYLSSQKDSRTIFSKTYEEHLLNKAKYLN